MAVHGAGSMRASALYSLSSRNLNTSNCSGPTAASNGTGDTASTLRAYYQRHATDLTLPKTTEEQVALLVEREPVPTEALAELGRRRLDAARERLSKAEGIPAERVEVPDAVPASNAAATGSGRVEFTIVAEAG